MTALTRLVLEGEIQRLRTALLDLVETVESIGADIDIAYTDSGRLRGNVGPVLARSASRARRALAGGRDE